MVPPTDSCPACSTPVPGGSAFCPSCGTATELGTGRGTSRPDTDRTLQTGEVHFSRVKAALADRYIVEREIGRGGMATVYLAQDLKHNRHVAVKVLHEELATLLGPTRFLREIEITARLQHPHILPVHDSGEAGGYLYYVMPFVEGESLRVYLRRRGPLPLEEVLKLVGEVASALSYAHGHDIVHRDIKPENILLSAGHAQVADFGIARAISAAGDESITQTGAVVGTPAYMAPEQASDGEHIDGRADLYALAAVACEALTGQRLEMFSDITAAERAMMIARPDLNYAQAKALAAPLALDRVRRPRSADEWLDQLREAEKRRRPWRWVVGITAAAVLGMVGGWAIFGGQGASPTPSVSTIAVLPFSVTGAVDGTNLESALPQAIEKQLRWMPDYRILSTERVRAVLAEHFRDTSPGLDTLTSYLAAEFAVSEVLWGTADVSPSGELRLEVQVREAGTQRLVRTSEIAGPTDSLPALVSGIVAQAFGERLAGERAGWNLALPRGLHALNVYLEGETYFRRGAYDSAVRRFDEVIRLDSAYAPAYVKRMLAEILRIQPTRATQELKFALDAAGRYKEGLDPTTRQLLEGYELLVRDGQVEEAQQVFQSIADDHPDAVDAWFILGYLRVNFGPLLGLHPALARLDFERAHSLDPNFAAAILQLARIAIMQEQESRARRYIDQYLQIDSTSDWAELIRMVDTLVYGTVGGRVKAIGSFDERPAIVLEMLALSAGEFEQSPVDREVAHQAIDALWDRARTRQERSIAFRMRLASLVGTGRAASAAALVRQGRRWGVTRQDLDQWILLTAGTGVASLGDSAIQVAAARRLIEDEEEDGVSLWLAARWYRGRDARAATDAAVRLGDRIERAEFPSPLELSLRDDLEAMDALEAGDTLRAVGVWQQATQRYSLEQVTFGLLGSLWPLHLQRVRLAAAMGDHDEALAATASFEHMAGFVDQVAWMDIWPLRARALRATGDPLAASSVYRELRRIVRRADGPPVALQDSVERWLEEIHGSRAPADSS